MPQKSSDFLDIDEVRTLFKERLNVIIKRTSVYHYIKNFEFPDNTGWGRPRRWEKEKVLAWFNKQSK
jgi:predicted DNA-binding transcriptional regulator AlpA